MGFYGDVVLPYCIDLCCGSKALEPRRQAVSAGLSGVVLEIGFGSGTNVPFYPPGVTRVLGVDPSGRAVKIAGKRIAASRCPVEIVGLEAEALPMPDASVDSALSTFTLCTIPDVAQALREVRRVLRPRGELHFVEHGRAAEGGVARWQDRLNGIQRALCGGCNLNRDIPGLLRGAGFEIRSVEAGYDATFPGPRTHGYLYQGVAVAP